MLLPIALAAEFIGTFVFFTVILASGEAIPVVVALLAAIYFGGHLSGGSFNPGVTLMMLLRGTLSLRAALAYVLVQMLAAVAAVFWAKLTLKPKVITQLF